LRRGELSISERDQQIDGYVKQLELMMGSKSWRYTKYPRKVKNLFLQYKNKCGNKVSRLLGSLYKKIPIQNRCKQRIKNFFYQLTPLFFKNSKGYKHWHALKHSSSIWSPSKISSQMGCAGGAGNNSAKYKPYGGKILVIDATTPTPDRDAGSLTAWYYLRALSELCAEVTFIPADLIYSKKYGEEIEKLGVEYLSQSTIISIDNYLEKKGGEYAYILLYRVHIARFILPYVKEYAPQAKVIFDTVDLHYLREERKAELSGDRHDLEAAAYTKIVEYETMALSDATIVLSGAEKEIILREKADLNICTIPLLLDIPGSDAMYEERQHIVFIGGFLHEPNIDAVKYFISKIWPNVKKYLPECEFQIIGANMPEEIIQMAASDQRIKAIGYVEDLGVYFNRCKISVAPLRYGAGIKGKIGTSASYGVPTVATSLAAEGMGFENGVNILIADDQHQFAKDLIELYLNKDLWDLLSKNSQKFVEDNFSYELGRQKLASLLSDLGSS
jgi:glycosyltransferase involved in cell wall biosynthesis